MKITQPDGDSLYVDEPVSKIVEDVVDQALAQGRSLIDAITTGIATAQQMEFEDDIWLGPRQTLKRESG